MFVAPPVSGHGTNHTRNSIANMNDLDIPPKPALKRQTCRPIPADLPMLPMPNDLDIPPKPALKRQTCWPMPADLDIPPKPALKRQTCWPMPNDLDIPPKLPLQRQTCCPIPKTPMPPLVEDEPDY